MECRYFWLRDLLPGKLFISILTYYEAIINKAGMKVRIMSANYLTLKRYSL